MITLKADGSLDVERINQLPIEEYIEVIENLTEEQKQYYNSHLPPNDGHQHTTPVYVDHTLEEEIENGAIDAESLLKQMREKYGLDSCRDNTDKMD